MRQLNFRLAKREELKEVLRLYKNALEEEFCVWNEHYPSELEINQDFNSNNLYVAMINKEVVGALSLVEEKEFDDYDQWIVKDNCIEMSRVVVSKFHHGKRIAKTMVESIIEECRKRKIDAIHIACQIDNIPAIKTYQNVGFKFYEKKSMFENTYYMCEYIL